MVQKIIDAWHRHQQRVSIRVALDVTDGTTVHEDILAIARNRNVL